MLDDRNEPVPIDYDELVTETDGAYLLDFGDRQEWVPRSLVLDIEDDQVWIAQWKAEELGLC